MKSFNHLIPGISLCIAIAIPATFLGNHFPVIGSPVFSILLGMILATILKNRQPFEKGIQYSSKKIFQYAVILLGFGLNLSVIFKTGVTSLPIIMSTILTSLTIAYILHKLLKLPSNISTLIGVGSSICGGSAIAATAPVIDANNEEVAQSISVIFFFNVLAALIFPVLGSWIGFSTTTGDAFGIFAGTAINDTSSVTAAASTWDSLYQLGSSTLDKAVTVKLTRTLAIIPITLGLAFIQSKKSKKEEASHYDVKKSFPVFILYFILASIITTVLTSLGVPNEIFYPMKNLSKFFITTAMAAIGLNTHIIKLIKTGGKPLIMGFCCWIGITGVSLIMQHIMGIW